MLNRERSAFVRTKLKDIINGPTIEGRSDLPIKCPRRISTERLEYSYNDGGLYYFMDKETFELILLKDQMVTRLNS